MISNSRKLILASEFWPKMLDKFYFPSNRINQVMGKNNHPVSPLAFQIVRHLPANTFIVNRGDNKLPMEFLKALSTSQIPTIDLNDTLSNLIENGIDPHYWVVTKTKGQWNYQAHQAVGEYLSGQLQMYLKESK